MKKIIIFLLTFFTIISLKSYAALTAIQASNNVITNSNNIVPAIVILNFPTSSYSFQGTVITNDGYLVTSCTAMGNRKEAQVTTYEKKKFNAALVGCDSIHDIALLRIIAPNTHFQYAIFNDIEPPKAYELLYFSDMRPGVQQRTAMIKVAAVNEILKHNKQNKYFGLIRTNVKSDITFSGIPVQNKNGDPVGILTAVKADNNKNSLFIIPTDIILKSSNELRLYGKHREPQSGIVKVMPVPKNKIIQKLKIPQENGIIISKIQENSPAQFSGLKSGTKVISANGNIYLEGDIILSVDNIIFNSHKDLVPYIQSRFYGDTIDFKIFRNGKTERIPLKLEDIK